MPEQAPVDPRNLLAAERTLLAWLRTGLSLLTFGFVIARIGVWLRLEAPEMKPWGTSWMGSLFGLLGALANLLAFVRYLAVRKAILENAPTPLSRLAILGFAASVGLLGTVLSAVVFLHMF